MNAFEIVFEKAYEDGFILYTNEAQKSAEESLHSFLFNQYLQETFNISITEDNYLRYCTYENFYNYLSNYYQLPRFNLSLTAIEKIDTVLKFFISDKNLRPRILGHVIASRIVTKESLMSYDDLQRCLNQLVKDGFITVEIDVNKKAEYLITWDGEYFCEIGGYQNDVKLDLDAKEAPIKTAKMQHQLNRLTWILAIAAGVSAIYYLIQIVEIFN